MTCFFKDIKYFSNYLTINAPVLAEIEPNGQRKYADIQGKAHIVCYSLQTWQKGLGISLCALAIITLLAGITSLAGIHIVGTTAAWTMVGLGLGTSIGILGFMSINHLLYVKQVGKFLKTQDTSLEWRKGENYPGYDERVTEARLSDFSYKMGNKTICGKRYGVCNSGLTTFYIEFHKT